MDKELNSKRIRNIYIMLIAILCLTIISSTAILSYIFVHWNDVKSNNSQSTQINNQEYDVRSFEEINYDKFLDKYNDNKQSLIYIGRETCVHCVNFIPVLKQAQSEYGYQTFYLDISKTTEKEAKNIKQLNDFLNKNFGSTPMVIIVKDGNLIGDGWMGESTYENFSKFLNNAGYEKKD